MDILKRLFRKPVTTLLWLLFVLVMTGALTLGSALTFSSEKLAKQLDSSHTAIAVRTDPAADPLAARDNEDYDVLSIRSFTKEDAAYFEGLDTVKAVRSNTLTAASSPSFRPYFEVRSATSWRAQGYIYPYYNVVFTGIPLYSRTDGTDLILGAVYNDIPVMNDEFYQAKNVLQYCGGFLVRLDISDCPDALEHIRMNELTAFCGTFNPAWMQYAWRYSDVAPVYSGAVYIMDLGKVEYEDGMFYCRDEAVGSRFPALETIEGDPADFFETTPHEVWREYLDAWRHQNTSLPVIGTDNLESMFCFIHGDAIISDGRSFTREEYDSGARSIIVSDIIARRGGVSVGDSIRLSQFVCPDAVYVSAQYPSLNNPCVGPMHMYDSFGEEEEFTVVGIYHLSALWSRGTYAVDPNTVFIPRSAQIPGGFGEIGGTEDIYGIYLSIELKNGSVDDFQLRLAGTKYAGQFYTFDQGYEAVQKNLNSYALSSRRLLLISVIGWVLFLLLYLLMYQAAQRHNLGVLRSLGSTPSRAAGYLFVSGAIVALIGILLGTLLSGYALKLIQNRVLAEAISGIDRSANGGALAISEESLTEMVRASQPSAAQLAVFAAAQFVLAAIPMLIQAWSLAKQPPRELLRK